MKNAFTSSSNVVLHTHPQCKELHQLFFMNEIFTGEERNRETNEHLCATEGTFFCSRFQFQTEKSVYRTNFINKILAVKYRRRSQIIS